MSLLTLAIDVGGSSIKAILLREDRTCASDRSQIATPHPATPETVVAALLDLIASQGNYDRLAIGFPSVVEDGVTRGAINLHPDWDGFPLAQITLGTGFGSSLFLNGKLLPNLELGQHIFRGEHTYEDCLGQAALDQIGVELWNAKLAEAIASLYKLFNFDKLYIGGGNSRLVVVDLPANLSSKVEIVSNDLGLIGGLALWQV